MKTANFHEVLRPKSKCMHMQIYNLNFIDVPICKTEHEQNHQFLCCGIKIQRLFFPTNCDCNFNCIQKYSTIPINNLPSNPWQLAMRLRLRLRLQFRLQQQFGKSKSKECSTLNANRVAYKTNIHERKDIINFVEYFCIQSARHLVMCALCSEHWAIAVAKMNENCWNYFSTHFKPNTKNCIIQGQWKEKKRKRNRSAKLCRDCNGLCIVWLVASQHHLLQKWKLKVKHTHAAHEIDYYMAMAWT